MKLFKKKLPKERQKLKAPGKIISTFIEVIGIKKAVRDSGCFGKMFALLEIYWQWFSILALETNVEQILSGTLLFMGRKAMASIPTISPLWSPSVVYFVSSFLTCHLFAFNFLPLSFSRLFSCSPVFHLWISLFELVFVSYSRSVHLLSSPCVPSASSVCTWSSLFLDLPLSACCLLLPAFFLCLDFVFCFYWTLIYSLNSIPCLPPQCFAFGSSLFLTVLFL